MPLIALDAATLTPNRLHRRSVDCLLITTECDTQRLPPTLLQAADQTRPVTGFGELRPPDDWTGSCFFWRKGETLLSGSAAQLRSSLSQEGRCYYVPIHYRYLGGLDLIALEPRGFSTRDASGTWQDCLDGRLRIGAAAKPGEDGELEREPWARVAAATRAEAAQPGSGLARLATLAQDASQHALLHSLVFRNIVVALMAARDWTAAKAILDGARLRFRDYRELDFLAAQLALAADGGAGAVEHLKNAVRPSRSVFIGSGGESSWRAHYLLATLAESAGRQSVAVHHFMTGVRALPAFEPAVARLLCQRLPADVFAAVQWDLSRLARREPRYFAPIFDFFLLHRGWAAARRMLRVLPLTAEQLTAYEGRLERLAPNFRDVPRANARPGVLLSGPLLSATSFGRINRYLACDLVGQATLDTAIVPTNFGTEPLARFPAQRATLAAGLRRLPHRLDLTIRHAWPLDFTPPETGRLARILPWELGAIPRDWKTGLESTDEIWTPSRFSRDVFERAGIPGHRIEIVPNGVDADIFQPDGPRFRPPGARSFCFLFVGGLIRRKGGDLLLRAWRRAFAADDDVCLVIKDSDASFYKHIALSNELVAIMRNRKVAPVLTLRTDWSEPDLAALYRGCDAFVLPYRGEGFGLPLLEALACGKQVVTTDAGPAPEFCPPDSSWMLPAAEVEVPRAEWPVEEMSGRATWFEPDLDALIEALRQARAQPKAGGNIGRDNATWLRSRYAWPAVTAHYRRRIQALVG